MSKAVKSKIYKMLEEIDDESDEEEESVQEAINL